MILGRPTTLWLGLLTALSSAVSATALLVFHADAAVVGPLTAVWTGFLGTGVILIANQPPTVKSGDTVNVSTPDNEPNRAVIVK